MAKAKKLFIWKEVLCDYTCGVIFAMASTPDEARKKVLENVKDWERPSVVAAMAEEPEVHTTSYGFSVWGGAG